MKDAYKGKVTKFLKGNKPKGSPIPKNWFEKGGTLEIETLDDGSQIWKYTSAKGDTVPYINQQVKFPKQYMFPDEDIAEFSIGKFTGDRELDKKQHWNSLEVKDMMKFQTVTFYIMIMKMVKCN